MAVALINLGLTPNLLHRGITPVTLTYSALCTAASDNLVTLVFSVDPIDPNVFIVDATGAQVKSTQYTQTFNVGAQANLTKVVSIAILNTPAAAVISPVSLAATGANQANTSVINQVFTYS